MFRNLLLTLSVFASTLLFSQEEKKEDAAKMIREVVNVEVDRAKFAPKPVAVPQPSVDPKKKKKQEEETPAEAPADTLPPTMPAPSEELVKRAQAWYLEKALKYEKVNGSNAGKNVSCQVVFNFKQKILNPENDVDGKIKMELIVEAKEGKYRYTVKNIKHVANKPGMSGGDIYNVVPECGSLNLSDRTWKIIKTESMNDAQLVIKELKEFMKNELDEKKDEW